MEATTRLYGREREQELLRAHFDLLIAGSGGLVLIGGEAGIGKTALVDDLVHAARAGGAQAHVGASHDLEATPPFGPWRDAGWKAHASPDGPEPEVPPVLRDEISGEAPPDPRATYAQAIQFLKQAAQRCPLVLVLDDLHWADHSSLELLRAVARDADQLPMLIVGTYRDDEIESDHALFHLLPVLVREGRAQQINLRPLSSESVDALLRDRVRLSEDELRRLAQFIFRSSEGNPLFLEEVLRALEEERRLERRDGVWQLGELVDQPIPHLIRLVIERRLSRFDEGQRELLALAALIGRDLEFDIWCAATGADLEAISELAARAVAARLLVLRPDTGRLRFSHALIREALYQQIGPFARRQSHLRVAELLLTRASHDAERLAHHFEQASDPRASEWFAIASDRAYRIGARMTAADRAQAALRSLETHNARPEERASMLGRLAWLCQFSDPQASERALNQALELVSTSDDENLKASLLSVRGELRIWCGRLRDGIIDLKQSAIYFRPLQPGEPARWIRADSPSSDPTLQLLLGLVSAGRYVEAIELAEELVGADLNAPLDVLTPLGFGLPVMAVCVAEAGQPRLALRLFEHYRTLLAETSDVVIKAAAPMWALFTHYSMYFPDDLAAQRRLADESQRLYEIASAQGDIGAWPPELTRMTLLDREGQWQRLEMLATMADPAQNAIAHQFITANLANVARRSGNMERAWNCIYEVLPAGARTEPGNSSFIPSIRLQQVAIQLCLGQGDLDAADE